MSLIVSFTRPGKNGRGEPVNPQYGMVIQWQVLVPKQSLWRIDLAVKTRGELVVGIDGGQEVPTGRLMPQLLIQLLLTLGCASVNNRPQRIAATDIVLNDAPSDIVIARHNKYTFEGAPSSFGKFFEPAIGCSVFLSYPGKRNVSAN